MKKRILISIIMIMLSVFTFGFFNENNQAALAYASEKTNDCFLLMDEEGNINTSPIKVGTVSGAGNFVVGHFDVTISVTAENNFQLVGWQIVFREQSERTQFVDSTGLVGNSKTITLQAKDNTDDGIDNGATVNANLTFNKSNGFFTSGSFNLARVFENITLRPVFKHIYYSVNINQLMKVSKVDETAKLELGATNKLYYDPTIELEEETNVETNENNETTIVTTKYSNAILKSGSNYFYYGDFYKDYITIVENKGEPNETTSYQTKYYTVHEILGSGDVDKVDYQLGAFRVGDEVDVSTNIAITNDLNSSTNIDLQSVSIKTESSNPLSVYDAANPANNYFIFTRDAYNRTESVRTVFDVQSSSTHMNEIEITYHRLFVIDLAISIDGSTTHDETDDVFGEIKIDNNSLLSNINVYNYYHKISNVQYLAKKMQDNNLKAFGVSCSSIVSKIIESVTYKYYEFDKLNNLSSTSVYYSNLVDNAIVTIDYLSTTYNVGFGCAEVEINEGEVKEEEIDEDDEILSVKAMNGIKPEALRIKRGQSVVITKLSATSVEIKVMENGTEISSENIDVVNVGYKLLGFALSQTGDIESSATFIVNKQKPIGTDVLGSIILFFEKIEYNVVFTNYNKYLIDNVGAINTMSFNFAHSGIMIKESLTSLDLKGETSKTLTTTMRLYDSCSITTKTNNGFVVLGYSLKPTITSDEDYLSNNSFVVDEDFITNNNLTDTITIYVYEELFEYNLTYFTTPSKENIIMSTIDVVAPERAGVSIVKYDINEKEISQANGNVNSLPQKIVVSGLYYKDEVLLTSVGVTISEGENSFTYVFRWFTEDGNTKLSEEPFLADGVTPSDATHQNHKAIIEKDITIEVVYSTKDTNVTIALDDDFKGYSQLTFHPFTFAVSIVKTSTGEEQIPEKIDDYWLLSEVGENTELTITISNVAFGYKFIGYQVNLNENINGCDDESFDYITTSSGNFIVLKFEQIKYSFTFNHHVDGTSTQTTQLLDIDHCVVNITKPSLGYYVNRVVFNENVENYSEELKENNDMRHDETFNIYTFSPSREIFKALAESATEKAITVDLHYEIFTYTINVDYNLTNAKGDDLKDDRVIFPNIELQYTYNGATYNVEVKVLNGGIRSFDGIPYNATVELLVQTGIPNGLHFDHWSIDGYQIENSAEYLLGTNKLSVINISEDKVLVYNLSYNTYFINIVSNSEHGSYIVLVNNRTVQTEIPQITVFDKLSISVSAFGNKGYKFKSINYKFPNFTAYEYSDETWNNLYDDLYYKVGEVYRQNTSSKYVESLEYYIYSGETVCYDSSTVYTDEMIDLSNYVVEFIEGLGNVITFEIEYEMLEISITNTIVERGHDQWATLTGGRGNSEYKIQFAKEDLAQITIMATRGANTRIIDGEINKTVTWQDVVIINFKVNNNATNIDGKKYDLRNGLKLKSVKIGNQEVGFTDLNNGEYQIQFSVQTFAKSNNTMNITYTLNIEKKMINVTTEVDQSYTSFYQNAVLNIAASETGFEASNFGTQTSKATFIEHGMQFLASAKVYCELNSNYQKYFEIAGVETYRKVGSSWIKIEEGDRAKYGIEVMPNLQVKTKLMQDVKVIFKIKPIISYRNDKPYFEKVFICDNLGNAQDQSLVVGETNADIILANAIVTGITVEYYREKDNSGPLTSVKNVGVYLVHLKFRAIEGFDWLSEIVLDDEIKLEIIKKDITLTYDASNIEQQTKPYDGKSSLLDQQALYKYFKFVDTSGNVINYAGSILTLQGVKTYITADESGTEEAILAKPGYYYNVYVYNFSLENKENFNLLNNNFVVFNFHEITKAELDLTGLYVYDKVYDGTDKAELITTESIQLLNIVGNDDVALDMSKLEVTFADATVGTNKTVYVNASSALIGEHKDNYYIEEVPVAGLSIYPYSISTLIPNIGEVKLLNKRGLTDKDMVDLIPFNAMLDVVSIHPETNEYANIYKRVAQYLKGNNEFAIAYVISFNINGENVPVNNELFLSIPNVKNVTNIFFLTGEQSGKLNYDYENGYILIDLMQINEELNIIGVSQKKILLKAWQIVLIVVLLVLVTLSFILTFVIIRKRKKEKYSVHEKI